MCAWLRRDYRVTLILNKDSLLLGDKVLNKLEKNKQFKKLSSKGRLRLLKMHYESKVGHIGGNLSAIDIVLYLYHFMMSECDEFVLAKGHAAGALYIALWSVGVLPDSKLTDFHGEGVKLAGHPVAGWLDQISVSTGSLGHGFPVACGMAMSRKLSGTAGNIYCLCSDGEWQEGSNWEALIFAKHHKLDNLVLIVDANRLQGFGTTSDVASVENMSERFRAFGFCVDEIDGHSFDDFERTLNPSTENNQPRVIVLNTVKGKGVSFMENKMEWHYLPMNEEQFKQAVEEVSCL